MFILQQAVRLIHTSAVRRVHRFTFGQVVHQLVKDAEVSHPRVLNLLYADTANLTLHIKPVGIHPGSPVQELP